MDRAIPLPVRAPEVAPPLDYYLILPETLSGSVGAAGRQPAGRGVEVSPEGIVVEEFVLAEDFSAVGLHSTAWTPVPGPADDWWGSAALSRGMRVDPALRARVIPVGRDDAGAAYRRLGGGELPDEPTLRTRFDHYEPLAESAPLRLGSGDVPDGFADRRVYRILFAKELDTGRLSDLMARWGMAPADDRSAAAARVVGTASRRICGDVFTWDLRRIGAAIAWCVDLTAHLVDGSADRIGPVLRELRTDARRQGLIPVTVERFS
jgi:hypothetical protein